MQGHNQLHQPEWVGLPPLFLFLSKYERTDADHDWHEIDDVIETDDCPTDAAARTIDDFLRDILRTHARASQGLSMQFFSDRRH